MANTNAPFGAIPVSGLGGALHPQIKVMPKKAGAIYVGDFLEHDAAGSVTVADAGSPLIGVAAESRASADTEIAVFVDPEIVYEIQCTGSFVAADCFQNANFEATAADTGLSRSKHQVDSATFNTTATLPLKIIGLSPRQENEYGSYAKVLVKINSHILGGGTGAAGI